MATQEYYSQKIIFSADGIRGIADTWPFTPKGIYHIGRAISEFVLKTNPGHPSVILGRDTRPSGEEFVRDLTTCLLQRGIQVLDIGIAPTPVVAYITKKRSASLGVMISASHNPVEHAGIKLINSRGLRLQLADEKYLETLINSPGEISTINSDPPKGHDFELNSEEIIDEYIRDQVDILGPDSLKEINLLVDCSNGAVARTCKKLLEKLGASVITINDDLTGHKRINEGCGSEQVRKDPLKFIHLVQDNGRDYGFAFDGDGDRIVIVDKEGNFYNGDDLLYVLAEFFRQQGSLHENGVVTTEMANSGLEKSLNSLGFKLIKTENGDKNLEAVMWEKGYSLGAEQVGNIIINDGEHGSADSLYAAALLCVLLHSHGVTLKDRTELLRKHPQVSASIRPIPKVPLGQIDQLIDEMRHSGQLQAALRVKYWYSSTEAGLFNVMMEGVESEELKSIWQQAYLFCQKILQLNGSTDKEINILDLSSRKRS